MPSLLIYKVMDLKCFKCVIDPALTSELEVSFVALVDRPAIERNFLTFKEQQKFAINEDRRIISGPAMLADLPMYRKDEAFGEYYVQFDAPTIFEIVQKFNAKGYMQNFNLFHDEAQQLSDVTIFNSFISDKSLGIAPMAGFEDVADGSWFISAKVENDATWNKIKDGTVKGFSVEGIFQYVKLSLAKPQLTSDQKLKIIMDLLSETSPN
jgi:hypothetical protein